MHERFILAAVAAFAVAGCEPRNQETVGNAAEPASAEEQQAGGGAVRPVQDAAIQVASKDPYGEYLVDGQGRALYVLEGSRQQGGAASQQAQGQAGGQQQQGQQGQQARNECTGECLAQWPPFLAEGSASAGQGVESGQISTTPLQQAQQVTYAGWPLYYYEGDRDPGSTAGQDVHDRWGGWYLLSPDGERIEGRQLGPTAG